MLTEIIATLTICADISICGSGGYTVDTPFFIGEEIHLFTAPILSTHTKMLALIITKIIVDFALMNTLYVGGFLFLNSFPRGTFSFFFNSVQYHWKLRPTVRASNSSKQLLSCHYTP